MNEKDKKKLSEDLAKSKDESLKSLQENIEIHKKALEIQMKKKELLQKIFDVSLPNIRMVTPEREFQKDDRYWELMKQWELIEHEHKILGMDTEIKRTEKVLNETIKQYELMK